MKGYLKKVVLAGCLVLAAGAGCTKPKPIVPSKPVPPGTVLFQFTKKVEGPVDLTVDGIRIPVNKVGKKCLRLSIAGLPLGKHHLTLLSPQDAFGPDQMDVDLTAGKGEFKVLFAQQFNSEFYGKAEPAPTSEGIPGVKATLLP